MRSIIFILILLCFVPLLALELTLKPSVKISNNSVLLEDVIYNIKGHVDFYERIRKTEILKMDQNQKYKNIMGKEIALKLQNQYPDLNIQIKGQLVSVYRMENPVKKEALAQDVKTFLKDFFTLSDKSQIDIISFPDIFVPVEDYRVEFFLPETQPKSGRVLVNAKVISDEALIKEFGIAVRISESYLVCKLNTGVKKGDRLKSADFEFVEKSDLLGSEYLKSSDMRDEMIAKFNLSKGRFLKESDFTSKPDVNRLDMVNVVIKGESFKMQYVALAKNSGWKGDRIILENLESRKMFQAEIVDKNTVMINLEGK